MSRFIFSLLFVFWVFALHSSAQLDLNSRSQSVSVEKAELRKNAEEKTKKWLNAHPKIKIYGKVVDQNGVAVSGAEIEMSWREPTLDLDLKVRSEKFSVDDQGAFICEIVNGTMPIVRNIHRDGYEFLFQQNPVVNLSVEKQGQMLVETSDKQPILLKMRKKGESTFLLRTEGLLINGSSPGKQSKTLDIFMQKGETQPELQNYADLQVEVACSPADGKWTVTYKATNGTDGIIVSDNLLYEAPEKDYQKEIVLQGPVGLKYLYLCSRTPAIYSRLDLEHRFWNLKPHGRFRIDYKAWINPYGSRNLEYETNLVCQWQLRKQLEREVKADLLQNKRPPKPDLPKLIKDAKERAEKNKGKQP